MNSSKSLLFLVVLTTICIAIPSIYADSEGKDTENKESPEVDENKLDYAKGSLCGYCEYCKFCKLCDDDCPCEKSATKPNCHMCKYCKYCYMCSAFCDTICQPGGIIDRVSAAFVNALPSHDTKEIDNDIDGVKHWIDKNKEEL